ncbi:hypothetical protein CAF53_19995 [Sphingobium sp. LB126]|uniref:NADP-dependent oxidoreductase n=1 Tax=Sphingobium sp. LB126 TaxID=1983755 RepID=UPI000C20C379|nr:NADP-dependent oxidoreductase [Sphingobium sp. LB126]PJG46455.1 hypothetical protein CAF53_19995 [Sphingobium sp. LB126]
MSSKFQAWTLIARPEGLPTRDLFELRDFEDAPLADGEVRVRNDWLTVGPAMRVRMSAQTRGYLPPYALGAPIPGWAVGEVIASRAPDFKPGDMTLHQFGMRDFGQGPSAAFEKLPSIGSPEDYLNAMGSTGFVAYFGLLEICKAEPGETLFVSGAAGAVGSTAVQIGKAIGLKVIASAGGSDKCALLRNIGADAVIDYKSPGSLDEKLAAAAPQGIDAYLDNVGGDHLDAALANANPRARFAISGMIGSYNQDQVAETMRHLNRIVTQRIRIEGFLPYSDRADLLVAFRERMAAWIAKGTVRPWQEVRTGLGSVPNAIQDLFAGGFTGKPLIRLHADVAPL